MTIAALTKTNTFTAGTTAQAAQVNQNFDELVSKVNELVSSFGTVTATATELNYVDGVTSAIQTQLDAKLAATATSIGKHTIWVPATAMVSRTTNGAAIGTVETSAQKVMLKTYNFDASTMEYVQFAVGMPKSWDEGDVTAQFVWSHPATTTNFGVVWGIQGVAVSNDDALDVAFGTSTLLSDTGGTTDDLYLTDETSAVTIGGTPAALDTVIFQVYREPTRVGDTMTVDARLHGVRLYYTTNAGTDA